MSVISWNTHKTAAGYEWRVYSVAYQQPTETLKAGTAPTRAIAKQRAQHWMVYLKSRWVHRNLAPRPSLSQEQNQ